MKEVAAKIVPGLFGHSLVWHFELVRTAQELNGAIQYLMIILKRENELKFFFFFFWSERMSSIGGMPSNQIISQTSPFW